MRLVRADGALLERSSTRRFRCGVTASAAGYGQWNIAQERTPWGRATSIAFALVDGDRVLASAKRYDLSLSDEGRASCPPSASARCSRPWPSARPRARGRASSSARRGRARGDGAEVALLFSEIGAALLRAARLHVDPVSTSDVDRRPRQRRAGDAGSRRRDPAMPRSVAGMHAAAAARYTALAAAGTPTQVRYSLAKKRLFAAFSARAGRSVEYFVAEEGHQAVAFLLLQVTRARWRASGLVERRSVRRPRPVRRARWRDAAGARRSRPRRAAPIIRGWWPRASPAATHRRSGARQRRSDDDQVRSQRRRLPVAASRD